MTDVSNLKINKRSNLERPNLRESLKLEIKIENLVKSDLCQKANVSIGKIAKSAKYRMDEQFKNFPILGTKFLFSELKKF